MGRSREAGVLAGSGHTQTQIRRLGAEPDRLPLPGWVSLPAIHQCPHMDWTEQPKMNKCN